MAPSCVGTESHRAEQVFDLSVFTYTGEAFGTTWSVKLESRVIPDHDLELRIQQALAEVDVHMSKYRDDSEISKARLSDGPVPISQDTALVVDAALDLAELSGGAFDPTVEPLMALWGFGGQKRVELPSDAEIEAVREKIGWQRVRLERAPDRLTLDTGGTSLDLGAIAKGHAVDRIHNLLAAEGYGSVFVEVGGEVRVSGRPMERDLWRVGVSMPEKGASPNNFALIVSLTNGAVATSGNYRNTYQVDGRELVHTIDPRQGRPVVTEVASATVIAPDCRTADGLATTLMVLPPDEGIALAAAMPDVDVALMLFDGEGFALRTTEGMEDRITLVSERVKAAP